MNTNRNLLGALLTAASIGGWVIMTPGLAAQEKSARRDSPPVGESRPDAMAAQDGMKIGRMMLEIRELRRVGKHDEARKMSERVRGMAGNNPRVAEELKRSMDGPRSEAKTDHRPDMVPEGPVAPARMKMQKLREAAVLLQSAGYEEQAAKARAEIGRIEAGMRHHKPAATPHRPGIPRTDRPGDASPVMVAELRKIRRDLEELRGEVRRMKDAAGPKKTKKQRKEHGKGHGKRKSKGHAKNVS